MKRNTKKYSKEIEKDVKEIETRIKKSKISAINNSAALVALPVITHLLPIITTIEGIFIMTIMLFSANELKKAVFNINKYQKNIKSIKKDNEQKNLLLQREIIKKEEELQPLATTLLDNQEVIKENTDQLIENKDTERLQLYSDALNIYEQLLYEYPQASKQDIEVEMDNQEVLKLTRKR